MPQYAYQGLDKFGKQVSGELSADDAKTATARAKAMGVFPTDIKVVREAGSSSKAKSAGIQQGGRIRKGDITIFSRQLANLVKSGLPLMRTFSALTEHTENPRFKATLERIQQEIKGGKALWEAMDAYSDVFSPLYVSMVKAGEASGQLSSVLSWLADYLEKEQARSNQVRSALAYPFLLLTVGTLTITSLVMFVVPRFISMFQEFGQALPTPTLILVGTSRFMLHWGWAIFILLVGGIVAARMYGRTPAGKFKFDQMRLSIPLLGKLNMKSAVSRFARTTATLLQGGITLFDTTTIVRDVLGNEVLAKGIDQVRDGMREGQSFSVRLQQTGVFPPLLIHMVGVGEETGDLQGVLITVANAYDVEVEATMKSMVSMLEPLIIVIIGSGIAFIILAMLLPIFSLNMMG